MNKGYVLPIRLAGIMQAWGSSSTLYKCPTDLRPSISHLRGFLACAFGYADKNMLSLDGITFKLKDLSTYKDIIEETNNIHGTSLYSGFDYIEYEKPWTANDVAYKEANNPRRVKYYLTDADFLVYLCCEDKDRLVTIKKALLNPVWPCYLGRKNCLPMLDPIEDNTFDGNILSIEEIKGDLDLCDTLQY